MFIVYSILNLMGFLFVYKKYSTLINPICIYSLVWELVLLLYNSGLVQYYPISFLTWIIIILFESVFIFGCIVGDKSYNCEKRLSNSKSERQELLKWLYITLIISSIAIVFNFVHMINHYGFNIVRNITIVYSDRLNEVNNFETIPYLSSFLLISISLAGIYVKKYGTTISVLFLLLLTVMSALTSGGRAGIVFNVVIFVFSYLLTKNEEQKKIKKVRKKILLVFLIILFFSFLIFMSKIRNQGIKMPYTSDIYYSLFGNNSTIYGILCYICSPIGVLNCFLNSITFKFGQNTFLPLYNLFAKVGIIDYIQQYQSFYLTPIKCNVGTYIREIIEDFTIPGALLIWFFISIIIGKIYSKTVKLNSIRYIITMSFLFLVISLSFFDWRIRNANIWIGLIFGYIIGKKIEKNTNS